MADLVRRPQRAPSKRTRLQDRGPLTEYLAFVLAGDVYAAPVALVHEIQKPPPLTPVPRAEFAVRGIISVRGHLITVYDLRRKMNVEERPATRRARVLLVQSPQGETIGLYVDEVLQVYRLAEAEIEPAATALGGEVAPYISGIARPTAAARQAKRDVGARPRGAASGRARVASVAEGPREPAPAASDVAAPDDAAAPVVVLLDLRALLAE
ncbi:MAG TPA: chemotaxis protein CheW [Byssovorax sp.]|jgi:purine-binding chemotaxis protein CheW